MNYYEKYIKYKNKYIKNNLYGGDLLRYREDRAEDSSINSGSENTYNMMKIIVDKKFTI